MSPLEIVAILLAGVAAGTINTVVGSGTLITFPTLLAFGIPPVTANVSNTIGLVPGSLSGAIGYRARARRASGPGWSGSAAPRCWAGSRERCCCCGCPSAAFDAIVPVLIVLGCVLVILGPRISQRVAARAEARGGTGRARRLVGVAGRSASPGVYGGYFGAAQGVLLMAILGIGVPTRCSGTTPPRTCWPCSSTPSPRSCSSC